MIEEEDRVYGEGVNIAARLEALADPGGICISKTAFDHIETKLPLGYEYLGEQTVKNIAKPVRVYRVLMEPEAAGRMAFALSDRPSLCYDHVVLLTKNPHLSPICLNCLNSSWNFCLDKMSRSG